MQTKHETSAPANRERPAREQRLFRRGDPDFPTTRALQRRLIEDGRVPGEGPLRRASIDGTTSAAPAAVTLRRMADFRRALAMPGVLVVRLDVPAPCQRRTVLVLRPGCVAFRVEGRGDTPRWLWFGPEHRWSFGGNRAVRDSAEGGRPALIYEVHLPGAARRGQPPA